MKNGLVKLGNVFARPGPRPVYSICMRLGSRDIDGLLIDLDGVLYEGNRVIHGAPEFVEKLKASGIPHRFVTNTTTTSRSELARKLASLGFHVHEDKILTAPRAARAYLKDHGLSPSLLLVADSVKPEFEGLEIDAPRGRAVVIGDIGDAWTYRLLDAAFREIMNGAELLALHKNKFWKTESGLQLDIGAFIAGLEYTTGRQAILAGKPSSAFFAAVARDLDLPPGRLAMIGDDIESDIGGAQVAGMMGVLVRTGKYQPDHASRSGITPDLILDSAASLDLGAS